jgi:nucleoside-diphosphate kinase
MERTLILFKPDAIHRHLVGRILTRFEEKGLRFAGLKLFQPTRALIERHYEVHRGRPFFASLVAFMSSGPLIAAVLEGPGAIAVVRKLVGVTHGQQAEAGTIRGDFGLDQQYNLVHASDGPETAAAEIALFFTPEELASYERVTERWITRRQ